MACYSEDMANQIETVGDYHWRNAMRPARFFGVDARASGSLFFLLLHMRLWTLGIVIFTMVLFYMLERKGLTFNAALRSFRSWLFGKKRPALLWVRRTQIKDYG